MARLEKLGMRLIDFKPQHLDGVAKIEEECFAHPWSRENLAAELVNDNAHFVVAVCDDIVAGYIGVNIICGEGYVTNIAVLPQYRRQGIAKALINKVLENDMSFLTLEVRESNIPAINLYSSFGFDKVGKRKDFYTNPKENAILMTKFL